MMKFGKNKFYINRDNFSNIIDPKSYEIDKQEELLNNFDPTISDGTDTAVFSLKELNNFIADPIRYYANYFWGLDTNEVVPSTAVNNNALYKLRYDSNEDVLHLISDKTYFLLDSFDAQGRLQRTFSPAMWESIVERNLPDFNLFYFDDLISINEPLESQDKLEVSDKNINYLYKKAVYNFTAKSYEEYITDSRELETNIPSFLSVIKSKILNKTDVEENKNIYLGASIPNNYVEALHNSTEVNDTVKEYFNIYPKIAKKVKNSLSYATAQVDFISREEMIAMRDTKFVPFPYYNEIIFSNLTKGSQLKKLLLEGDVSADFLDLMSSRDKFSVIDSTVFSNLDYVAKEDIVKKIPTLRFNVSSWLEERAVLRLRSRLDYEREEPYYAVKYYYLMQYFKENIKPLKRKFLEFVEKPSHSEVLFYRIEKYNARTNQFIQEYIIVPDESEDIRFIDTQIKYGVEYNYKILQYVFAAGNRYRYENYYSQDKNLERQDDIKNGLYKIKVKNYANYYIHELKLSDTKLSVLQPPPTKPRMHIEKLGNDIEVNVLDTEKESHEKFEFIENTDFEKINPIRNSQKNLNPDIVHCQDTLEDKRVLQIYRTMSRPTNFLSFQGKLYKTINIDTKRSFVEQIVPNIKYYYLFRYVNEHNTPSNVSEVFEIEMKDEEGYTYLNVNKIDLNKTAEKVMHKNFKRYLMIRPSVVQTHPESNYYKDIQDSKLGPVSNSVWNKDFMVRITSKKTNRVIEFNLKSIINRKKD